jgi:signal transduction histidine kinase
MHDVGRSVADSIELLAPLAEREGIRLVNCVGPGALTAYCDRTRVGQVLGNLLGNALKFTPEGGTISVAARAIPERDAIEVSVSDTGAGIPARDIPHLFDRYWQGTARRDGIGLGLSIVKALVELQGGTVSVASIVGGGSTFAFTLPARRPVAGSARRRRRCWSSRRAILCSRTSP